MSNTSATTATTTPIAIHRRSRIPGNASGPPRRPVPHGYQPLSTIHDHPCQCLLCTNRVIYVCRSGVRARTPSGSPPVMKPDEAATDADAPPSGSGCRDHADQCADRIAPMLHVQHSQSATSRIRADDVGRADQQRRMTAKVLHLERVDTSTLIDDNGPFQDVGEFRDLVSGDHNRGATDDGTPSNTASTISCRFTGSSPVVGSSQKQIIDRHA